MVKCIFIIVLMLSFQVFSQGIDDTVPKDKIEKESYYILSIDSTEIFYLYKAQTIKKENVLLVVDKKSVQLIEKKIKTNCTYTFNAYRYYDIFSLNANLCHYIDDEEIWCHSDKVDLRFTDGMGDKYVE